MAGFAPHSTNSLGLWHFYRKQPLGTVLPTAFITMTKSSATSKHSFLGSSVPGEASLKQAVSWHSTWKAKGLYQEAHGACTLFTRQRVSLLQVCRSTEPEQPQTIRRRCTASQETFKAQTRSKTFNQHTRQKTSWCWMLHSVLVMFSSESPWLTSAELCNNIKKIYIYVTRRHSAKHIHTL